MSQTNATVARQLYEAFTRRDSQTCMGFFHSWAEWTAAENFIYSDRSPYVGVEAIQGLLFGQLLEDWDDLSVTATEVLGDGDLVIASGRFKGKFKANGSFIDAEFVQVFQFSEGKIAKCQMYTDTAQFKEVTGRRTFRP